MTSREFNWTEILLTVQRPAVLVAMKRLSAESCRYGNLFSRLLCPLFWVCLFSTLNVGVESLHTPSLGLCRAGVVLQRFHRVLRVWTRIVCVEDFSDMGSDEDDKNRWLDLREWGQQPILEGKLHPFQCKWAQDKHTALCIAGCKNWVCTNMRNSLAAELNCMGGEESVCCGDDIWVGK